jgi:hypothetical protein
MNVDNTGRTQSKFCREGAGQQAYAVREARADHLAEASDPFGQLDPVYSVLQVRMVAADVNLAK